MRSNHFLSFIFLFFSLFLIAACGGEPPKADGSASQPKKGENTTPKSDIAKSVFSESPSFPDATLGLEGYKDGTFSFNVSDYELAAQTSDAPQKMCANSGKGQHIHLIVDNKPYAAKYVNEFDYEIADGDHHVLAFLSRSYHESIKTAAAHQLKLVTIKDNTITEAKDVTDPMVLYSRPKGTYKGSAATKKVMLDFFTANAPLGSKYQIKANINGEDHMINTWQPYYIEGLPMGKNTISLSLLDMQGNLVKTPLNPVTREFTLEEDPLEKEG